MVPSSIAFAVRNGRRLLPPPSSRRRAPAQATPTPTPTPRPTPQPRITRPIKSRVAAVVVADNVPIHHHRRKRMHAICGSSIGASPAWRRYRIEQQRGRKEKPSSSCSSSSGGGGGGGVASIETSNATPTPVVARDAAAAAADHLPLPSSSVVDRIKSFSIGSIAGMLGSLAGMGGGFVMIPMMTAAAARGSRSKAGVGGSWLMTMMGGGLGLHQHKAHGTSLFAVGTTGLAGALGYGLTVSGDDDVASSSSSPEAGEEVAETETKSTRRGGGLVELDTALALATTAMFTARLGAIASTRLSERALQRALGAFMMCVAPLVPGKAYLEALRDVSDPSNPDARRHLAEDAAMHPGHAEMSRIERLLPASFVGLFSGFLSGIFGVGGGAIVVPALVLGSDMTYHSALGTSLLAMVLPSMVGTYAHAVRGNVDWRVAPMLALGSAAGAYVGGREVGTNMDEGVLRMGFSCLMLVLGVKTWRKGAPPR